MIRYILAYRYAVLIGIGTTITLFVMQQYQTWPVFLGSIALWSFIIGYILRRLEARHGFHRNSIPLIVMTALGFVGLTSLIELDVLRYILNIAGGIAMGLIFANRLRVAYQLHDFTKQWRRVMMMLWAFAVYAWGTVLFALHLFFPRTPLILFALVMGLVAGYSAVALWNLYKKDETKELVWWGVLLGIGSAQLFYAGAYALPFGYLAMGLLLVWPWYMAQLLVRFHLSSRGILWEKQRMVLLSHAILYCIILFQIVRWI